MKWNSTEEHANCHLSTWYPHQVSLHVINSQLNLFQKANVEALLVGIALLCVPIMLCGKPLVRKIRQRYRTFGDAPVVRKDSSRKLNRSKNIVIFLQEKPYLLN